MWRAPNNLLQPITLGAMFVGTCAITFGIGATSGHRGGRAAMTDRSYEIPQDADFRSLVRVVSACTLGLWAFAVGLLIGVFLFS